MKEELFSFLDKNSTVNFTSCETFNCCCKLRGTGYKKIWIQEVMSHFNINRLLECFLSDYKRLNSYDNVIQTCHNVNEYFLYDSGRHIIRYCIILSCSPTHPDNCSCVAPLFTLTAKKKQKNAIPVNALHFSLHFGLGHLIRPFFFFYSARGHIFIFY